MSETQKKQVYLDSNATTIPYKKALEAAKNSFEVWGNPSSVYQKGTESKNLLWESRKFLSEFVHCEGLELIFTSGASESNNFAIKGLFGNLTLQETRKELIISAVEHPSVMAVADDLSSKGFKVHKVPVSQNGTLDEDFLDQCLSEKTKLVSIMMANNETGLLFSIKKLAEKAHKHGAFFHSDMVQALSKIPVDLKDLDVDMASFSAHKCHALKGCGLLYCKKDIPLKPLIFGGSQEKGRRSGTENLVGIAAFAAIAKDKDFFIEANKKIKTLRDQMEEKILEQITDVKIVGFGKPRLPNTTSVVIDDIQGESLLISLDLKGFCVSLGSACNSGKQIGSPVLEAMGWTKKQAKSCLRVSLDYRISSEEIACFVKALKASVEKIRSVKENANANAND